MLSALSLTTLLAIPGWAYLLAAFAASFAVFVATALRATDAADQGSAE